MRNKVEFKTFSLLRRMDSDEGIDRISNMPDAILCKIFSHMPTKYALGTKILSTRWKNLSPFEVPPIKLELDDTSKFLYPSNQHSSRCFINFVDKLLYETLRDRKSVESVFLRWHGKYNEYGYGHIDERDGGKIVSWVRAVLRLNVVCLNLNLPYMIGSTALLHSLNGCTTLVELELGEAFSVFLPREFIIPNLKYLSLNELFFSKASINGLLGGCPMLNELYFNHCKFLDGLVLNSSLLKLLVVRHCSFEGGVEIYAPNIEVLAYIQRAGDIPDWVGDNFKSLDSADLAVEVDSESYRCFSPSQLAKDLKAFSSATRLCLVRDSITALHTKSVQLSAFRKITWLGLSGMDSDGFELLACFLKSAPFVRTITFDRLRSKKSGGYARFESLLPTIPVCLKQCLTTIEFLEFEGEEDEMKLIEYFLKNGRELQNVRIHYSWSCKDTNIIDRLRKFPKQSQTCGIHLEGFTLRFYNRLQRSFPRIYIKVFSVLR